MLPRLNRQKQQLEKQGYNVIVEKNTLWKIQFAGPAQTPFEGGQFEVQFDLESFPFKGPVVSFKTQIYHPNVDDKGQICPCLLQIGDKWAPTRKLVKVMDILVSLMVAPNIKRCAINQKAAEDYKNNTWFGKAKQLTPQYAK